MKDEPMTTLHIRNYPESLRLKCRIKAASGRETLEKFVQRILKNATKDITEPRTRPKS